MMVHQILERTMKKADRESRAATMMPGMINRLSPMRVRRREIKEAATSGSRRDLALTRHCPMVGG